MLLPLYRKLSNGKNNIYYLYWMILILSSLYFYIIRIRLDALFCDGISIVQFHTTQLGYSCLFVIDKLFNSYLSLFIWHSIFSLISSIIILLIVYGFITAFWIILSLLIWSYNCHSEFTSGLFYCCHIIYFGINNLERISSTFVYFCIWVYA